MYSTQNNTNTYRNTTTYKNNNLDNLSINDLVKSFSTSHINENDTKSKFLVNKIDEFNCSNPFYNNGEELKHSKRKRNNFYTEMSKKYRIDYMIPIENVIQSVCGKTNIESLTVKELKLIINKKNLIIPDKNKMIKEELKFAVENELYYNEYCDDSDQSDDESKIIKSQKNTEQQNSNRAKRLILRNKKRNVILQKQKQKQQRKIEFKNTVFNLSTLFDSTTF